MSDAREPIPAQLTRDLMLEVGYRCAIPTCRVVAPLEIEHIEDYAKVQKHEFHNMIVLCRNCHGLKGKGPKALDRKALKQLKANLGLMNHRYNDTERRLIEHFVRNPDEQKVMLPATEVLFQYLVQDGLLVPETEPTGLWGVTGEETFYFTRGYELTKSGRDLVARLRETLPVEDAAT